jgi:hypothetical protein
MRPLLADLTWRLPVALLVPEQVYLQEAERKADGNSW